MGRPAGITALGVYRNLGWFYGFMLYGTIIFLPRHDVSPAGSRIFYSCTKRTLMKELSRYAVPVSFREAPKILKAIILTRTIILMMPIYY